MNLNKVTISGADNAISHGDMLDLQNKYPFVEWGILVSKKRMGEPRYPTLQWIHDLPPELNISLHLCGEVVRDFVNNPTHEALIETRGIFWQRTQLNFSFKDSIDFTGRLTKIAMIAEASPGRAIVLAYNKGNKMTLDMFIARRYVVPVDIHFLYDSSGGRGTEIKTFHKPLCNYTGYAGGINPDNIGDILKTLSEMDDDSNIWIDMESGVRTNNMLDLVKVESVLKTCVPFIENRITP